MWKAPVIGGLTEPLAGLSEAQRNLALKRLEDARLLTVNRDGANQLISLDAHPLIREYFAERLKAKQPDAWQAGHQRLYEYLRDSTKEGDQPTLEELQPLYQAVAHGCHAGLLQEACLEVYRDRIQRGSKFHSTRKIGAYGSDLGAVACFFETPWSFVSLGITEGVQAWLLNEAGFRLRALGRLTEAVEPVQAGLDIGVQQKDWKAAAARASNLSELRLILGAVSAATADAEQCVNYADLSGNAFQRMRTRTTLADCLHQAGMRAEAQRHFRDAEQMQAERSPTYPCLPSFRGFQYCDLLLAVPERAAWSLTCEISDVNHNEEVLSACGAVSRRAALTIQIAEQKNWLLDIAVDHLTIGRCALYGALLATASSSFSVAANHISDAVSGLRRAGQQQFLPFGLLTAAWCSFAQASEQRHHGHEREAVEHVNRAQADLDEAWDIASRGPMPLYLADIHLHRARLFGREQQYPWESPAADLAAARELIEKHGYWRRREELEDAEAALLGAGR